MFWIHLFRSDPIFKAAKSFTLGSAKLIHVLLSSWEPLKTHFSDASCHVDDNISKGNSTKCDFKCLQMSLCMILICGGARCPVSLAAGRQHQTFPELPSAWLHWLGVTTRVRGQFGVKRGSSVLSNKTAGPEDWIRPVSWQQAAHPHPEPVEHRSGVDWDCRTPFSFYQLLFICSYNLALMN